MCADAVLQWFKKLQWDGAISQAMLHSIGIVLERVSDEVALDFVKSLMEPPALISPLQVTYVLHSLGDWNPPEPEPETETSSGNRSLNEVPEKGIQDMAQLEFVCPVEALVFVRLDLWRFVGTLSHSLLLKDRSS